MVAKTLNSDDTSSPEPWSITLSIYFVIVVSMAIWIVYTRLQLRIDADDAMRLAQVRDLLAGQGWFDLTQHRPGFAEGTTTPLSRLVDAPIAGFVLFFEIFFDREQAEALTLIAWPGLLFGLVVASLYTVCFRLGGPKAAVYSTVLASILIVQTGKFDPGSLDHSNLQMALVALAIVGFVMGRPVALFAGLGGASIALSVAVGTEVAAQIIVIFTSFAIVWALRGEAEKRFVTIFATSAAVTLCLAFIASVPMHAYRSGYCDAFSIGIALPALVATVGLAVLAGTLSNNGRSIRFVGIVGLALVVTATVWALDPTCFMKPSVSLDPLLKETWLNHVVDTKSMAEFSPRALGTFIGCFVGWLISIWFVLRDLRHEPWTLLCLLLAVSLITAANQGYNQPIMSMLSVLPTSILAARLVERKNPNANVWTNVGVIALLLMSIPAITGAAAAMKAAAEDIRNIGSRHAVHRPSPDGVAPSNAVDQDTRKFD